MTISTYTDLQTAVANWTKRGDLTSNIPDFIWLFEAWANRNMRVRQMETSATVTPASTGTGTLPTDFAAVRRVTWTGNPIRELEFLHPSLIQMYYPSTPAADPIHYTIEGGNIKVRPTDTTALEFDYWQKLPALITNASNWLLTESPDVYLFGTLAEAYGFVKDIENASFWGSRRDAVIEEIKKTGKQYPAQLSIRPAGVTP